MKILLKVLLFLSCAHAASAEWQVVGVDRSGIQGLYRSIDTESLKFRPDGNIEYAIKYSGHKDWNVNRKVIGNCVSQQRDELITPTAQLHLLEV